MHKRIDYLFTPSVEERQEEPVDIAQRLVELFDKTPEEAGEILALIDGIESYDGQAAVSELLVTQTDLLLPMISEEGFSERVKYLWEALVNWVKTVIGNLTAESLEMRPTLAALKFKAENVRILARRNIATSNAAPFLLDRHIEAVSVFYKVPTDMNRVNGGLLSLIKIMQSYLDYVDTTVLPGVAGITRQVAALDPMSLTPDWVDKQLVKPASVFVPSTLMDKIGKVAQTNSSIVYGPQMLGNVRLKLQMGNANLVDLRSINEQRLSLVFAELAPRPVPKTIEFPRFTMTTLDQTIKNIVTLTELIQKSIERSADRKRQVDAMIAAFDRFVQRAYLVPDGNRYVKEQSDQLIRLSRTLTGWLVDPYRGMVGVSVRAMRGALALCELNSK